MSVFCTLRKHKSHKSHHHRSRSRSRSRSPARSRSRDRKRSSGNHSIPTATSITKVDVKPNLSEVVANVIKSASIPPNLSIPSAASAISSVINSSYAYSGLATAVITPHIMPPVSSNVQAASMTTAAGALNTLSQAKAAAIAAANSVTAQILKHQKHSPTTTSSIPTVSSIPTKVVSTKDSLAEKEAEQKRLEEEMRKRRERIEKWRNEKKLKEEPSDEPGSASPSSQSAPTNGSASEKNGKSKNKRWNLDDDDDDTEDEATDGKLTEAQTAEAVQSAKQRIQDKLDLRVKMEKEAAVEEEKRRDQEIFDQLQKANAELDAKNALAKQAEEDEIDPLDQYMNEITKKARTNAPSNGKTNKYVAKPAVATVKSEPGVPEPVPIVVKPKVQIMMGVAKAAKQAEAPKGQIMEQDIDGFEELSDGEQAEQDKDNELNEPAKSKTKSELVFTDHTKVYYRPFKKNFYVEVPEITLMTAEEVDLYRVELEGIKIKGKNCPKPIKSWAQCGVSFKVLETLKKSGFDKPTPIQAQGVPIIMSGRDMIGIAKTGSGKTLAFLLPMFRHILDQPPLEPDDGPIAILMTPTRELAMQIAKECKKFTKHLGIRVVAVYGGSNISEQIAELKRGAEIIVCTPGRMIDMLAANNGRVTNLRRITYIVLDEADRMFDLGFEPQVTKILDNIRPDRQTVMFSATFPKKMEDLARRSLLKPIEVTVGGRSVVCKEVEQHVVVIEDDCKYLKLLELLGIYQEEGSIIVFVDKQEHADELVKNLLKNSYPCMAIHGGVDQCDRESIINFFKSSSVQLLVATSIAARGLDVKDLILVVNYDCPNHYEDYVHRCGRTGRAGNKGFSYTFITPEQKRYAGHLIKALELSSEPVPPELKDMWDNYVKEMEAMGKKVKACSGGFEGKGFKFNAQEEGVSDERKKLQKVAFDLHVDSDDEDADVDLDEQIEDLFKSKRTTKNKTDGPNHQGGAQQGAATAVAATPVSTIADKLKAAKDIAEKMASHKTQIVKDSNQDLLTRSILGGTNMMASVASKTVAEQIAEKLNMKLNYTKQESSVEQEAESFKIYEEELEINDFPQQARWKITSKDTISHICEYAEVGVTVRGSYFPPEGKPPGAGERKLFLAIESLNEKGLSLAKSEISRIIKEEISKLQNPALQLINKSRYKII